MVGNSSILEELLAKGVLLEENPLLETLFTKSRIAIEGLKDYLPDDFFTKNSEYFRQHPEQLKDFRKVEGLNNRLSFPIVSSVQGDDFSDAQPAKKVKLYDGKSLVQSVKGTSKNEGSSH